MSRSPRSPRSGTCGRSWEFHHFWEASGRYRPSECSSSDYEVLHLNPLVLQSFIYLKLSVAGHLTLFVARTKGPFWSVRPAKPLFLAVILTQLTATIITVYGILLPAMGWELAAFVWGYALVSFVVTDSLKVLFYRRLNREGGVLPTKKIAPHPSPNVSPASVVAH